jgi:hypothetical protein
LKLLSVFLKEKDLDLVAAWGETIESRDYLKSIVYMNIDKIANKYNHEWKCFDLTKYGHPCHPLMRKKDFSLYKSKVKRISLDFVKVKATFIE